MLFLRACAGAAGAAGDLQGIAQKRNLHTEEVRPRSADAPDALDALDGAQRTSDVRRRDDMQQHAYMPNPTVLGPVQALPAYCVLT